MDEIQEHSHKLDEIQQRLDNILGLRRTTSRDSLVSLAGSINTKKAYKKLVKDLFAIGVTAAMINEKEKEIKGLFGPQQAVSSNPMDSSTSGDQDHHQSLVLEVGDSSSTAEASPIISSGNQHLLPELEYSSDAEASPIISTITNPKSRSRFDWARPPIDFLVGPRMIAAAQAGDAPLLISTLRFVRNINFTDSWGRTALHNAAANGHSDIVWLLLSKSASVVARDFISNTPLHRAAFHGHTSIVELLLTKGALIEALNENKHTPLHLAILNGYTSTVELLLTKGASVETTDYVIDTPLHDAARRGYTGIVELLLTKGAPIEALNNKNQSPLHLATFDDQTSTVELLLTKGASVETTDYIIDTPLHDAARHGYTSIVELLLAKGAPTEALNEDKHTPLHLATLFHRTDIIKLLENKAAGLCIPENIRTISG